MSHLRDPLVYAFAQSLSVADSGALLHLLTCPICAAKAVAALGCRPGGIITVRKPALPTYTAIFDRLGRQPAAGLAAARDTAREQVARLVTDENLLRDMERRAGIEPSLSTWPLAWELRSRGVGLLVEDPARAERFLRLSIAIGEVVARSDGGAGFFLGAWVGLAAARRLLGDHVRAAAALDHADRYVRDSIDPDERATFCRELAELRRAEGRYEEALALFERAASLFEDFGQIDAQASAWVAEAELYIRLEDFEGALECSESAVQLAAEGIDPVLALRAGRCAAVALLESGLPRQAREILAPILKQYGPEMTPRERAELLWIEGRIATCLGEKDSAQEKLWRAWSALQAVGEPVHAIRVALDLAELYTVESDTLSLQQVLTALESFVRGNVAQNLGEAVLSLIEAARGGRPFLPLLAALGAFLVRTSEEEYRSPCVARGSRDPMDTDHESPSTS